MSAEALSSSGRLRRLQLSDAAFIAVIVGWLVAASLGDVFADRIFPFDSALIAANGGLFQALFSDLGRFAAAPVDWLWGYYEQYPALSVRRHPPLFGFVSGIVYSIMGVSTTAAKLTVMLFGVAFAVGAYAVARKALDGRLPAFCAALLIVATPQIGIHFYSVWLDIPSLAFAIWVFYFYLCRLEGDQSLKTVLGMVIFSVLALYTYQPTVVLLAGPFLHLLLREWRTLFTDRNMLIGAALLVVLMLPLAAFTLHFAQDNLQITTGEMPDEWQEFASPTYADWMVRDKLSFAYWAEYGRMMVVSAPVQSVAVVLWLGLLFVRRPRPADVVMFTSFLVTYLAFSWLLVKGHRYLLYMLIPTSVLAASVVYDLCNRFAAQGSRRIPVAAIALVVIAVVQAVAVPPWAPYTYLSGLERPISAILDENPDARILYSGRGDAGFVFYLRSLDIERRAQVQRASVQVSQPDELDAFLADYDADYLVLEASNPGYDTLEIMDQFRDSILARMQTSSDYAAPAVYELPYGVDEPEGYVTLHVYRRQR